MRHVTSACSLSLNTTSSFKSKKELWDEAPPTRASKHFSGIVGQRRSKGYGRTSFLYCMLFQDYFVYSGCFDKLGGGNCKTGHGKMVNNISKLLIIHLILLTIFLSISNVDFLANFGTWKLKIFFKSVPRKCLASINWSLEHACQV